MKSAIEAEVMAAAEQVAAAYPGAEHAQVYLTVGGLAMLRLWAHWRDGHQEVGTCGTTLADAERAWLEVAMACPCGRGKGEAS